jgi:hypothetical protein
MVTPTIIWRPIHREIAAIARPMPDMTCRWIDGRAPVRFE